MKHKYKISDYNIETKSLNNNFILIFNTLSGKIIQIPIELDSKFREIFLDISEKGSTENSRIFQVLLNSGILINDQENEFDKIKNIYYQKASRNDFHLSIMTTLDCNFSCSYCFESPRQVHIQQENEKIITDFIQNNIKGKNIFSNDWYGGEPLLHKKTILRIQKKINKICSSEKVSLNSSMTTNGYLLEPEFLDQLVDLGINTFQITIDGPEHIHDKRRFLKSGKGSFTKIVENTKYAIKKSTVNIRVNIDKNNYKYLDELILQLSENGLHESSSINFKAVVCNNGKDMSNSTFSPKEFSEILDDISYKAHKLGFNVYNEPRTVKEYCIVDLKNQFILGPDLFLYKCSDEFNTTTDPIGKLNNSGNIDYFSGSNKWFEKKIFNDDECRICNILPQCMGGCSLKKVVHKKNWCADEKHSINSYIKRIHSFAP